MRILVIEDDPDLCGAIVDLFRDAGYQVEAELDGLRGLARLRKGIFDLLVLDIVLPGRSGLEILSDLRRQSRLPVIVVTGMAETCNLVKGLELGADDYVAKPFDADELLARTRAILRRCATPSDPAPRQLEASGLALSPASRNASYCGKALDLTAMECEILELLLRSVGRVVTRDELSLHLYNRTATAYDRTIDTHVSHIRRKLGEGRNLIISVRGAGYQLCVAPPRTAAVL
jgi:two-component system, OmpR family, response regulator CpxR